MDMYDLTIPVFLKMLGNLEGWIDKAIAYAQQKKVDPELFVHTRLALDQFDFARQIQSACDTAKYAAAKLTAKEPPAHPDTEKTLDERTKTLNETLSNRTLEFARTITDGSKFAKEAVDKSLAGMGEYFSSKAQEIASTLSERTDAINQVLGSRALESSQITLRQPFYREAMGKTFNWILRRLGLVRFRDTQCGFKLLEGEAGRRLFSELTIERFAYDVELVLLAERHGLAVAEVGVRWADSAASRVNPLVDSARMLWDVLRLSLRRRKPRPR